MNQLPYLFPWARVALLIRKRAFTLALRAEKLSRRPHILMLREDNVRRGFFEPAQLTAVLAELPEEIRPLIRFASITGWRWERCSR